MIDEERAALEMQANPWWRVLLHESKREQLELLTQGDPERLREFRTAWETIDQVERFIDGQIEKYIRNRGTEYDRDRA